MSIVAYYRHLNFYLMHTFGCDLLHFYSDYIQIIFYQTALFLTDMPIPL